MSDTSTADGFDYEDDLEAFMEDVLPRLLASLDVDILIIGRQVTPGPGSRIDLLAISATGDIYIIELKVATALPTTTLQVIRYRHEFKGRSREDFISLVAERDGNLPADFERHFGHQLPDAVNEVQHVIVIAADLHPQTANDILGLQEASYPITAFRYSLRDGGLYLIPACRDAGEPESTRVDMPLRQHRRRARSAPPPLTGIKIRVDLDWFWKRYSPRFVPSIVTASSIYDLYLGWTETQIAEGSHFSPLVGGPFFRQLSRLVSTSAEWSRVYLPPGTVIDPYQTLTDPPSTRSYRAAGHWIVGYQRNPCEGQASGAA